MILVGYGMLLPSKDDGRSRCRAFPGISVRERVIPMWAIVSSTWLLIALTTLRWFFPSHMRTVGISAAYGVGGMAVGVLTLYVLYFIIAMLVSACRRWEGWDVAKEYLKGKKQRLCPVITFDDAV